MSVRAVCVCRLLRARTSPGSLNTKEKGFFGFSRRCTGGRGGLTLGLGINVFEKKMKKKCYLRSERIGPVTWHFRVYRISLSFCELDERRDSSFFYSRNAGLQHYRGICLCGNGLLSICAGRVCAGTGFRFFSRDHGIRDTGFSIFHGTRDTGYGISHFARDHGIRDTGFRIFHGTTG